MVKDAIAKKISPKIQWQKILKPVLLAAAIAIALLGFSRPIFNQNALALSSTAHPPLTLATLNTRIAAPVRQGGGQVVDLTGFTIDLRPETSRPKSTANAVSAEQFYQRLQRGLNSSQPLGLDLSNTLIQGDLNLARVSLRMLAYSGTALPTLDAFNQSVKSSVRFSTSPKEALARTFLIQPQNVQHDTFVFQGPLLLTQACFSGLFNAADLYFLGPVEANQTIFTKMANWHGAKFARSADFSQGQFQQESSFHSALFASRARFQQATFAGRSNWQGADFQGSLEGQSAGSVSFAQADFHSTNFSRSHWQISANFDQAVFHDAISFQKSRFDQSLLFTNAQFESATNFRQAQFQQSVSLRGARVLSQVDFGDALFADGVSINVADLDFNAGEAKILGSPGQIGQVFSVPTLVSNETVLRNLVRNFRLLEQVGDANQLEYTTERLRLAQIKQQIFGVSLNQAKPNRLRKLGLNAAQVAAVISRDRPFVSRSDLLDVDQIDLATYLSVRDRVTTQPTTLPSRLQWLTRWLLLSGLLLLSDYGTNVGLVFSVGLVATTLFGMMLWVVDRFRQGIPKLIVPKSIVPKPMVPKPSEVAWMISGGGLILLLAISVLYQCGADPLRTLVAISVMVLPVPMAMMARLYQQGHDCDLIEDSSYFVKNGAMRRLQVLIARLPIIPQFPFYRNRYLPLLMNKPWGWLNYYDFSLNNWFKFGFNDIRMRDHEVPSMVSVLVWYQWSLGTAYIALLLWTLSRTIPGLNLLLYF